MGLIIAAVLVLWFVLAIRHTKKRGCCGKCSKCQQSCDTNKNK